MWSREQEALVGDTALEAHGLSPFQADSVMLGQFLSASVLNQHKDISLGADSCASSRLTRGLTAAPQEAQGKMQCLGSRTQHSQPHTHQEAQAVLQEILRKEVVLVQPLPMTYTGVKGCLLLLSSCSQEPSWGCLSLPHFPNWQGAALQGQESQGLPSTRSAGKHKALGLVSAEIWGQGEKRLQDFNPCSSEFSFQNIF